MNSASKQKFWLEHLKAWRQSELSNVDYCARNNLNNKLFSSWKTKLYKTNPELKSKNYEIPVFLPVDVVRAESTSQESGINIYLSSQMKICVSKNFDEDTLSRVVAIISKQNV